MSKVALCFAGLPRMTDVSVASWRALINQHDTDVFVHTWANSDPLQLQQWIAATYSPKTLIVEKSHTFNTDLYKPERIWAYRSDPKNVLSMWYSIGQSLRMADIYANTHNISYDYVCRARFDWHCDRFDLQSFDGLTVPDDPGLCNHHFQHRGKWYVAHNDQFGYGNMSVMRDYSETFHRIPWLYSVDKIDFCSELFLTTNMITKRIPVKLQTGLTYRMVR